MRSVNDYVADLEADRGDREAELRALLGALPSDRDSDQGKPIRRSMILLIYAHVEGFVRFALSTYLEAVNARALQFRTAATEIAATSASDIFLALSNPQKKSDVFRRSLPDDSSLHRVARQQEFVAEYESRIGDRVIRLSERALNFESNLNADVLRRNLFMVGLGQECVELHGGSLNRLLHVRNAVAHGDRLKNPDSAFVDEQMTAASGIMEAVQAAVQQALIEERYKRLPQQAA